MTPYALKYAGVEWPVKVQELRETLQGKNADAMVLTEHVSILVFKAIAQCGKTRNSLSPKRIP